MPPKSRKQKRTQTELAQQSRLSAQLKEARAGIVAALVARDWAALDSVDARFASLIKRLEALEGEGSP